MLDSITGLISIYPNIIFQSAGIIEFVSLIMHRAKLYTACYFLIF
jgi:hypothetical protein